jgi:hypothetical protein
MRIPTAATAAASKRRVLITTAMALWALALRNYNVLNARALSSTVRNSAFTTTTSLSFRDTAREGNTRRVVFAATTVGFGHATIPWSPRRSSPTDTRLSLRSRHSFAEAEEPDARRESTHSAALSPRQQILSRFEACHGSSSPAAETKQRTKKTKARKGSRQKHHQDRPNTRTIEAPFPPFSSASAKYEAERKALIDTLDWLEGVVIGYNLCPFAEAPMLRSELSIEVVLGNNEEEILGAVLGECLRLRRERARGTALVVCPDLAPTSFMAFLEIYNVLVEGILPDRGLEEDLQIAPFHPLFVFGDGGEVEEEEDDIGDDATDKDINDDAIDNYTNRSPHPTFHVLREAEVEKAVQALDGNAEKVWKRNVDLLRAMEDLFVVPVRPPSQKLHGDCGGDIPATPSSNEMEENASSSLLRSVFLKGKAGATQSNCPVSNQIRDTTTATLRATSTMKDYKDQIQNLLKEFRKKVY